jgi:hypothetical protein
MLYDGLVLSQLRGISAPKSFSEWLAHNLATIAMVEPEISYRSHSLEGVRIDTVAQ